MSHSRRGFFGRLLAGATAIIASKSAPERLTRGDEKLPSRAEFEKTMPPVQQAHSLGYWKLVSNGQVSTGAPYGFRTSHVIGRPEEYEALWGVNNCKFVINNGKP
jgi:hypothetical protein